MAVAGFFVVLALLRGRWQGSAWRITVTAVGFAVLAAILGALNLQEPTEAEVGVRVSQYLASNANYTCEVRKIRYLLHISRLRRVDPGVDNGGGTCSQPTAREREVSA